MLEATPSQIFAFTFKNTQKFASFNLPRCFLYLRVIVIVSRAINCCTALNGSCSSLSSNILAICNHFRVPVLRTVQKKLQSISLTLPQPLAVSTRKQRGMTANVMV